MFMHKVGSVKGESMMISMTRKIAITERLVAGCFLVKSGCSWNFFEEEDCASADFLSREQVAIAARYQARGEGMSV